MSNFQPRDTVVNLYAGVPITSGLQVAFRNTNEQAAWFEQYREQQITGMTTIRAFSGSVKLSGEPRAILNCNYLSFNNVAFEGKPFYGKITSYEYVNPMTVEVFFSIDYWQTFMHDAEYRSSKIQRQHLSESEWQQAISNPYRNDIIGLLTDENLPASDEFEVSYQELDYVRVGDSGIYQSGGVDGERPGVEDLVVYSHATNTHTQLVMQVAHYEGSDELEDEFVEVYSPQFYNGFGRGFFLGVVGDLEYPDGGPDSGSINMIAVTSRLKRILDFMSANNVTHNILGIWAVPQQMLEEDIQNTRDSDHYVPTLLHNVVEYERIHEYNVTVNNPKLRRSPFRYFRVTSPSGDTKDFAIERFDASANYDSSDEYARVRGRFRLYYNFDDVPVLTMVPADYDGKGTDYHNRMSFTGFPQVGYVLDGFLAHIGAVNSAALLGESSTDRSYRKQYGSSESLGVGGELQASAGNVLRAGRGDLAGAHQFNQERANRDERAQLLRDAETSQGFTGSEWSAVGSGDAAAGVFEHQRGALIGAGEYVAGNANNSLGLRLNQLYFEYKTVTLRPEIIKQYDDYLTRYGYVHNTVGIPHIASWTKGGSDPHFVNFDGLRSTYCKTDGLKVHSIFEPAAQYITALFDSGCTFIDGSAV